MDYQRKSKLSDVLFSQLHLIMLYLVIVATIAIFTIESGFMKLVLSIFVGAYTINLLIRSELFKKLLKISLLASEQKDRRKLQWDMYEKNDDDNVNSHYPRRSIRNTNNFVTETKSRNQEFSSTFLTKNSSFMDVKNKTMQNSCFSNNQETKSSENQQSQAQIQSPTKSSIKPLRGFDISNLFENDVSNLKFSKQSQKNERKLVLGNGMVCLTECRQRFLHNLKEAYEHTLETTIKKQRKYISNKYIVLMEMIRNHFNKLLFDHKQLKQGLIKIAYNNFNIIIKENQRPISQQLDDVSFLLNQPRKCSFQVFFYKVLLLFCKKIDFDELGFSLKKGIQKEIVMLKLNEPMLQLFVMISGLGLNAQLLSSRNNKNTQIFVENYTRCIQMVQFYTQHQSSSKQKTEYNRIGYLSELAKSKAFALHVIVKQINQSLKYSLIRFNHYLDFDFGSREEGNIQFQINKRAGSEGPYLHYDLSVLQHGRVKMEYCCQPGETNYLSVLYLLLFQISKKKHLYMNNTQLTYLIARYV